MADLDIRLLAGDTSEPLTFAKISEFSTTESVYITDYTLVSGMRDGEELTRKVTLGAIAEYFQNSGVDPTLRWFIPVLDVNTSTIHWELHSISETGMVEDDPSATNPIHSIYLPDAIGDATRDASGLMSSTDKIKLDDSLSAVTDEHDGLMTVAYKTKLDAIEAGANKYILPTASTSTLGGVKVDGSTISITANGVITANSGAPSATSISITAGEWDLQTHTVKVNMAVDTTKLNTINVDASSLDEWINCRVHAISEDSTGITFACQNVPSSTLNALVLSTTVHIV